MTWTVTNMSSGNGGTSGSFTTSTGRLYFAVIHGISNSATVTPSTGLGITWTQLGGSLTYGASLAGKLWSGVCTSGSTGTITFSGTVWYIIDEVNGAGAVPIVQTGTANAATTITLSAFASTLNMTYSGWVLQAAPSGTIAAKSGWTQLANVGTSPHKTESQYIITNDTAPSATFSGSVIQYSGGWAVEVAAYVAGGQNTLLMLGCGN